MGFPGSSAGKESICNAGDLGVIPGLGRSPGGGKGYPLQYSGLENSMDYAVHEIAESDGTVRLSLFSHSQAHVSNNIHQTLLSLTKIWNILNVHTKKNQVNYVTSILRHTM